jgi:hypothetical protein
MLLPTLRVHKRTELMAHCDHPDPTKTYTRPREFFRIGRFDGSPVERMDKRNFMEKT